MEGGELSCKQGTHLFDDGFRESLTHIGGRVKLLERLVVAAGVSIGEGSG